MKTKAKKTCAMRRTPVSTRRRRSLPKATISALDEALRIAYDDTVPGAKTRLEILTMLHS